MSFIIANGNSNDASIYDTGVLPLSTEDVYSNGFTVQINANLTVNRLRNDASDYYLPNTAIPIMTSNTLPSGTAISGGNGFGFDAWKAFDRTFTSAWQSNVANTGWVGYMFPTGKIIKRYSIYTANSNIIHPRTWTFEGSNDGSSWTILDTQTLQSLVNSTFYTYPVTNTTSFTYYRINITATSNITGLPAIAEFEMTESTSNVIGKITGGGFVISSTNLTVTTFDLNAAASGLISITAASGTTSLNITSSVTAIAVNSSNIINNTGNNNLIITCPSLFGVVTSGGTSNSVVLSKSGSGTLTINGTVTGGGSNGGAGLHAVSISGSGDTTITGDVNARASGTTNACYGVSHTGSGKLIVFNVNGAGNINSTGYAISSTSTGNLEITGNVTGGVVAAAINKSVGTIIMTGNCIATTLPAIIGTPTSIILVGNALGAVSPSIQITGTGIIDITGNITAGSSAPGIQSTGLVKLNGVAYNANRYSAIYAPQWTIESTTTSWRHQTFAGADITLYASGASLGNPALGDVRFGTVYGPSGTLVGTLRVPNPNTVLLGNLTDNTTGTLLMTPADFVSELNTSTASVAVRLRNCATVATTGDQIASYNI